MSPTTLFAYVRIISPLAGCSCRCCAKNVGGLGISPESRFLKRLAASDIWRNEGLKLDFESPSLLVLECSQVVGSDRGPANTDIKDDRVRSGLDLGALSGPDTLFPPRSASAPL